MPTAAGQIWPHLPHDDERVAKQSKRSLAETMYPAQSKEARAWKEICERNRAILLRNLRETRLQIEALRKR
jgi:hypothetical protein